MATERRKRTSDYVGPKETISREDLGHLEATGDWLFEEKHDGFWCLAEIRDGRIVQMSSRVGLAFEGVETAGLLGERVTATALTRGRLVGELTADANAAGERCGTRRLHLFDVLDWNGIDLRDLPQTERREALALVYGTVVRRDVVKLVEQRAAGAVAFFDEVIARGGEGIVAKHRDARYRARCADGKIEAWTRAKKRRTVDYIVVGHGVAEKGTPNLDLGLWRGGKLVKVLTCVLPPAWRVEDPQALVGRVVEAAGWEIWPSGALRHAQLCHRPGPRVDKDPRDCTYDSALRA